MTDDRNSDESRRILERVSRQSDPGQGLVARSAGRLHDHLNANDADQDDRIEVIGTQIGRFIAAAITIAFFIWLFVTLARGG